MSIKPKIIKGGIHVDDRGSMRFINDFKLDEIKRFYFIKHPDISVIRAWQGHKVEKKLFYPISGSFLIAWVEIDNFDNPSMNLPSDSYILNSTNNEVLTIPGGYANGLMALEPNSEVMVLSDFDLKESIKEKNRYPSEWWFDWKTINKGY